jgi:hypothetical protein
MPQGELSGPRLAKRRRKWPSGLPWLMIPILVFCAFTAGNVARHTLLRLDSFVDGTAGKRLTYKDLIA